MYQVLSVPGETKTDLQLILLLRTSSDLISSLTSSLTPLTARPPPPPLVVAPAELPTTLPVPIRLDICDVMVSSCFMVYSLKASCRANVAGGTEGAGVGAET